MSRKVKRGTRLGRRVPHLGDQPFVWRPGFGSDAAWDGQSVMVVPALSSSRWRGGSFGAGPNS